MGSRYMLTGDAQNSQPYRNWSSFTGTKQGGYFANDASLNYKSADLRMCRGNNGSSSSKKPVLGELEDTTDATRGPRRHSKNTPLGSSSEKEQTGRFMNKYQFNIEDFRTEYANAKFYVIKSYNEDNVHKSVKYNVWSSTPDGNKKLDAAFRDKMAKTSEAGIECPIFLFFSVGLQLICILFVSVLDSISLFCALVLLRLPNPTELQVNGSGQFVGVAEMIGPVDFDNNLNFWEYNKWNGYFPVKWHIIKDVPNAQLRHIILENNDNRPVTFTRDTQEVY